mgnify:CR=1 FL=1
MIISHSAYIRSFKQNKKSRRFAKLRRSNLQIKRNIANYWGKSIRNRVNLFQWTVPETISRAKSRTRMFQRELNFCSRRKYRHHGPTVGMRLCSPSFCSALVSDQHLKSAGGMFISVKSWLRAKKLSVFVPCTGFPAVQPRVCHRHQEEQKKDRREFQRRGSKERRCQRRSEHSCVRSKNMRRTISSCRQLRCRGYSLR